jgi:hypothetical protein
MVRGPSRLDVSQIRLTNCARAVAVALASIIVVATDDAHATKSTADRRAAEIAAVTKSSAWRAFVDAVGATWHVVEAGPAGTIRAARGRGIPWLAVARNDIAGQVAATDSLSVLEQRARAFVAQHSALLGAQGFDLDLDRRLSGPINDSATSWYLQFGASASGLAIDGASLGFFVSNGNLVSFTVDLPPKPPARAVAARTTAAATPPRLSGRTATSWENAERRWRWTGSRYEHVWVGIVRDDATAPARRIAVADDGTIRTEESLRVHARATGGVHLRSPLEPPTLMPLPNLAVSNGTSDAITDSAGRFALPGSPVAGDLSGPFANIVDACGNSFTSASGPDLDFGSTLAWDCATPKPGAPGNTAASRTSSYHVNRIRDLYRSYDSLTAWLDRNVEVRTNFQTECANYFDGPNVIVVNWNGGSAVCNNAGVNPDLLYHEWGHAYQWHQQFAFWDAASREGYADVTGMLQIHDHCLGRGFYRPPYDSGEAGSTCSGYREMDYRLLDPPVPARPDNIANEPYACQQTSVPGSRGIAGFQGHCESHIMTQAVYELGQELSRRYGPATGWNKLLRWWIATGTFRRYAWRVVSSPPLVGDGCEPHNWYMALRFVADDDGDLANGVPDGEAIFTAFDRHGIACPPAPGEVLESSACPSLAAPTLALSPRPEHDDVVLSWTPVPGALGYEVLRSELGEEGAFARVAVVDGATTTYVDRDGTAAALHWYAVATLGQAPCRSVLSNVERSSDCVPAMGLAEPPDGAVIADAEVGFAWTHSPVATSYELRVGAGGDWTPVLQTAAPSAQVASALFEPGVTYNWQVSASGLAGTCVPATSPSHTFIRNGAGSPAVTSIDVTSGPARGGTEIRIQGSNLFLGTTVLFDGLPASRTTHLSLSEMLVVTPPGFPGPAAMTLRTLGGQALPIGSFLFESGPSTLDLLRNGGMEIDENLDNAPDGWKGFSRPTVRRRCPASSEAVPPHEGKCAARLRARVGQPATIKQVRKKFAGGLGDRIVAGAWLRGVDLSADAVVRLKIALRHQGAVVASRTFRVSPGQGSYGRVVKAIEASAPYDKVVVQIIHRGSGGSVFVDDVAAVRP